MTAPTTPLDQHPLVIETERFLAASAKANRGSPTMSDELSTMLAGPHTQSRGVRKGWETDEPTSPEDLAALQYCLPRIFLHTGDILGTTTTASLLAGMQRHQCWKQCLTTEDGAFALAAALIAYVETAMVNPLYKLTEPEVRAMLNTWLDPIPRWWGMPGPVTISENMFGVAWCALMLDGCEDSVGSYWDNDSFTRVARVVSKSRPTFLPGLCLAQDSIVAEPLPAFWGPSL
jgi:hypothetical protein